MTERGSFEPGKSAKSGIPKSGTLESVTLVERSVGFDSPVERGSFKSGILAECGSVKPGIPAESGSIELGILAESGSIELGIPTESGSIEPGIPTERTSNRAYPLKMQLLKLTSPLSSVFEILIGEDTILHSVGNLKVLIW